MLSTTHTTTDIKARILKKEHYGFTDESLFTAAIEDDVSIAMLKYMLPALGSATYNAIKVKDKTNLTDEETALYRAEMCFSTGEFLKDVANRELQKRETENVAKNAGGVTESTSGMIGKEAAADKHVREGFTMMRLAGYVYVTSMNRGGVSGEWRASSTRGAFING